MDDHRLISGTLEAPHAVPAEEVLRELACDRRTGLDLAEVARRRTLYGINELSRPRATPTWLRLLRQFREVVVLVLIGAAAISLSLGETLDAVAILAIVLLNGALGFLHEEHAARAIEALAELAQPRARVLREGRETLIPAPELVPGDVIHVEAGDSIPADARLVESTALRTQEAALTGESTPVDKDSRLVLTAETPLADRRNTIHLGTVVAAGRAIAVVVATGMTTELGRIAELLQGTETRPTPLQERLAAVGRLLASACLAIVAALAGLHVLRGEPLGEVLVLSIGLAVAAVPEGLPAVVTIALALGMRRLVERNALVRQLPGVETLGSVTVICTDKTGTLTRNEMTVRELCTPSGLFRFGGSGYSPDGAIERVESAGVQDDAELERALGIGARCNNARLVPPAEPEASWTVIGDPTDGALLVAARKAGLALELGPGERIAFELPFDSERARMSVAVATGARVVVHVKGAAEVLLPRCTSVFRAGSIEPLDTTRREAILGQCRRMAARALRVLALAFREGDGDLAHAEDDLVFAGLVGMQDPPREEVPRAVRDCLDAGIRPVMITGDHPDTAIAIAREIGLAGKEERAVSGIELDRWNDSRLAEELEHSPVFARTSAEHKLRIVRAWRARDAVVAMTGDGINDAPALQEADIGIAMGRGGTGVTREAADMVLLDDNFASIVAAVREGRGIFENIRKSVHFLLTANLSEIGLMVLAAISGWPVPFSALQLLWINLVTDGLPALALAVEPTEADVMRRPPRSRRSPVVSRSDGVSILIRGLLLMLAAAFAYRSTADPVRANTVVFAVLVLGQLAFAFAFRSRKRTLPELGLFSNSRLFTAIAATTLLQLAVHTLPSLRALFKIEALGPGDWPLVLAASLAPVTAVEVAKLLRRWPSGRAD